MFFFFNDTATTEIYTLSLHDALPISRADGPVHVPRVHREQGRLLRGAVHPLARPRVGPRCRLERPDGLGGEHLRSEEHTSELQSRQYLVCRLLLEKKNPTNISSTFIT